MTERKRLKWLIDGVRSSTDKSEVGAYYSLEYYLLYPVIHDFDLAKNQELWDKFKKALQEHPLLEEREQAYSKFAQPDMAAKGYWWYNPENWK